MKKHNTFNLILAAMAVTMLLGSCNGAPKSYSLTVIATNDVHSQVFDSTYLGGVNKTSFSKVSSYVKSLRSQIGNDNVLLLDVGDLLQGDPSAHYFNSRIVSGEWNKVHPFFNMLDYMGCEVSVVGNHDIEASRPVYDNILSYSKIPFLAANIYDAGTKKCHFREYAIIRKSGLKIAVIGFSNPLIPTWVPQKNWDNVEFGPIYDKAEALVKSVRAKENPDFVILALHVGDEDVQGKGEISSIAQEGKLEYLPTSEAGKVIEQIEGIDLLLVAHDHRTICRQVEREGAEPLYVLEGGSKCNNISRADVSIVKQGRKVISKHVEGSTVSMEDQPSDPDFNSTFDAEFQMVKEFVNKPIGKLVSDVQLSEALDGDCAYMQLLHGITKDATKADISIAAPLSSRGIIPGGDVKYLDLYTIYRYENELYIVEMTGNQIKDYLELSYDGWINGTSPSYNFDSAAGINYSVDCKAAYGNRVNIKGMADGSNFDLNRSYTVCCTSYRASGLLSFAKVIDKLPQIRDIIYDYFLANGTVDPSQFTQKYMLGTWSFVNKPAGIKFGDPINRHAAVSKQSVK